MFPFLKASLLIATFFNFMLCMLLFCSRFLYFKNQTKKISLHFSRKKHSDMEPNHRTGRNFRQTVPLIRQIVQAGGGGGAPSPAPPSPEPAPGLEKAVSQVSISHISTTGSIRHEVEVPELSYGQNPRLPSASSGIDLQFSPDKGRYFIATQDLSPGAG